jgi:hypothetical protein
MLITVSLPYVCVVLWRWSKWSTWRRVGGNEWGRGYEGVLRVAKSV